MCCTAIRDLIEESKKNASIKLIKSLMKNAKVTYIEACRMLEITEEEKEKYKEFIQLEEAYE